MKLQVHGCRTQAFGFVIEHPEACVASAAKHATDDARAVAVIDRRTTYAPGSGDGLFRSADRAVSGYESQVFAPPFLLCVVAATALVREAATAQGSERRRVRPTVGVLLGEGDVASSTVQASNSHCSILPAERPSWVRYGNAVTPNCAEVIACALVEAITGEDIDRYGAVAS